MKLLVAVLALTACDRASTATEPAVDPVSLAEATAFADRFAKAALPCDETKLRELFDDQAMMVRFRKGGSSIATTAAAAELERTKIGAKVVCAWQAKAEAYKVLRVRMVDGQPRPLLRRIALDPRTKLRAVAYDELMLGTSRTDHQVRVIDIYPYIQGQWLTEALRGVTDATLESADGAEDAKAIGANMKQARAFQDGGEPAKALALIDAMPPKIRKSRAAQIMRVAVSGAISQEAYKQALDEVAATFPDDASVAMIEIDGAFLRKDYDAALRYIDAVDKAIGGDPWQDAIRAEAYLQRKRPGDTDKAAAHADAAVKAEPDLAKAWWAKLDVALATQQWSAALADMDELSTRFKIVLADAALRTTDVYAGLVASPEYSAWRAKHP